MIEKNKVTKNWEMKIKDLIKFLKAYDKFINAINNVLGNHITSIESIDLGGNRGTQIPWLNGKDLNDLILLEREIQKTKTFQIVEVAEVQDDSAWLKFTVLFGLIFLQNSESLISLWYPDALHYREDMTSEFRSAKLEYYYL